MSSTIKSNSISFGEQKLYEKLTYLKNLFREKDATGNRYLIVPAYRDFRRFAFAIALNDIDARRLCFEIASAFYFSCLICNKATIDNKINLYLSALMTTSGEDIYRYTEEFIRGFLDYKDQQVHNIIKSAKDYISEHLSEDLSVSRLAGKFYVTPNYFSRLFKRVEGEGCNEYIVRLRIEKAMSLLETTSFRTGKIASMVGYHDNNYFSLSFKKVTGVSPTKYRDMIKEKPS